MTTQEMTKLENFKRNVKNMSNEELVIVYGGLNRKSVTNSTELNGLELEIVTEELLARLNKSRGTGNEKSKYWVSQLHKFRNRGRSSKCIRKR